MKKWMFVLSLAIFALSLLADEKGSSKKKEEAIQETKADDQVKVKGNQEKCPIDGSKLDKTIFIDYQGQRVYFCKKECSERFKMVPEDCFGMLENKGHIADNVQDKCLLTGDKLENHDLFVKLPGRKIYFCCDDCYEDFKKDPKKNLKNIEKLEKK